MNIDKLAGFPELGKLFSERDIRASAWVYLKRSTITETGALTLWLRYQHEIVLDFIKYGRQFYDISVHYDNRLLHFKERIKLYRKTNEPHPSELPLVREEYWPYND